MSRRSVGVLEVGFGNLPSLERVLCQFDVETKSVTTPEELLKSEFLIIPGVGSFKSAMTFLEEKLLDHALRERCLQLQLPTLGICLGGQILLSEGKEGGTRKGLSIFSGIVEPLETYGFKGSHTGWDEVCFTSDQLGFFKDTKHDFFFNHDYFFSHTNSADSMAVCISDFRFDVGLAKYQTFAVQFHPEKSQKSGIGLIQSFLQIHDV